MSGRAKDPKPADTDKFMKLDEQKRRRILNATMKEFRYGYKKASTDVIVKDAGISKGLLFHYFGTKEQLFIFTIRYASDLIKKDYFDILDKGEADILEILWQASLLKKDISSQHPYLYDFLNGLYFHIGDVPNLEMHMAFEKEQQAIYDELIGQCNKELFRADINYEKAITIISTTIGGIINDEDVKAISSGGWDDSSYERFLETLREYLDIFRLTFYKGDMKDSEK